MKELKTSNLLIAFAVLTFNTVFAMEDDFHTKKKKQEQWSRHHTEATRDVVGVANHNTSPRKEFSKLPLNALPHLELYHLYLRDHEGTVYHLVKDKGSETTRFIRLYGAGGKTAPNYVTLSDPSSISPKEAFINPLTTSYNGSERHPTTTSTSYPTGVRTYHLMINGKEIELQQGHNIPYIDTIDHEGEVSTDDPENYVPQNEKYNSPIRRDLESELRKKKLKYKEISIYHSNCIYKVKDYYGNNYRIPVPEGFLFITFNKDGEISNENTYYFPNLVDYNTLRNSKPYKTLRTHYRISNLSEWFLLPEVTLGLVEEHQEKVNLAEILVNRLLLLAPTFFSHLTEDQMPPKARVALLTTLLGWNLETAATLEFLSFKNQLKLVDFYSSQQVFFELDDRYEVEKRDILKHALRNSEISPAAKGILSFLKSSNCPFTDIQCKLQKIIKEFQEVHEHSSHMWAMPYFFPSLEPLSHGGQSYEYNIATISPTDIDELKRIVGGLNTYNLPEASYIFSIINRRARESETSIGEQLNIMRICKDRLQKEKTHHYWEKRLVKHKKNFSLLDYKQVADYYGEQDMETEKAFWLNKLVSYVAKKPTIENFINIAKWCMAGHPAFLQSLEEKISEDRAGNMLALQILTPTLHFSSILTEEYPVESELIMDEVNSLWGKFNPYSPITEAPVILAPICLEPYLSGVTGQKIKKLYYLFVKKLNTSGCININELFLMCDYGYGGITPIFPRENFETALAKDPNDSKYKARMYHKLGFSEQASKAAKEYKTSADSPREFKDLAVIFYDLGDKELADTMAEKSLEKAEQAQDSIYSKIASFTYAIEAFHRIGMQEKLKMAKEKYFEIIAASEATHYEFVTAAIKFHKLGLYEFANEAARKYYSYAKKTSDFRSAVLAFRDSSLSELAKEAAELSLGLAETEEDRECAAKIFNLIGRSEKDWKELLTNPDLTTLDLSNCHIGNEGSRIIVKILRRNNTLTDLNLANNEIRDTGLKDLRKNPGLVKLTLKENQITSIGVKDVAAHHNITYLDLGWNEVDPDGLGILFKSSTLKYLNLNRQFGVNRQSYRMDDSAIQVLADGLANNTTLLTLSLSDNNINGSQKIKKLAGALTLNTTLTSLDLSKNNISDTGMKVLSSILPDIKSLNTLNLSSNNINVRGIEAIGDNLNKNTTLTELHLSRNNLGSEGAMGLAGLLIDNTTLTNLILDHNQIGNLGAKCWVTNASVKFLDLSFNGVGDDALRDLARNTTLISLNLSFNSNSDNPISAEGKKSFQENTSLKTLLFSNDSLQTSNYK